MYEYLQALHQRFFQEPEHNDLHEEINALRRGLQMSWKLMGYIPRM